MKHINNRKPQLKVVDTVAENNEEIKEAVMTTSEKIAMAQAVLDNPSSKTKRIKRDKGLIERTESSKTILTEDNKELLND